jgi:ketosteroid isomerase-like protein
MLPDQLFTAVATFDAEALAGLLHPDARISEMPNAVNTTGTERDRATALEVFEWGRELLRAQSFDVHERVVAGDTIAARATWHGTLKNGQELTAHIATFTQVRDGQIVRHATYDCYEPF